MFPDEAWIINGMGDSSNHYYWKYLKTVEGEDGKIRDLIFILWIEGLNVSYSKLK
ncbi:MAG: hypothetical protein ACTSR0_03470 [Candidatus Asgardarchaeia archaeon]